MISLGLFRVNDADCKLSDDPIRIALQLTKNPRFRFVIDLPLIGDKAPLKSITYETSESIDHLLILS